jgi:hypothetical protein
MNWEFDMTMKKQEEREMSKDIKWYEEYIEKGIRKEVKLLRDNGFNTECSCDHEMYIQCQYLIDGEIQRLHNLLFTNGYRNYTINVQVQVIDGCMYPSIDVSFKEKGD